MAVSSRGSGASPTFFPVTMTTALPRSHRSHDRNDLGVGPRLVSGGRREFTLVSGTHAVRVSSDHVPATGLYTWRTV